ncbi:MAG: PIN domain-containing protein [Candidatus Yanofskybacteria bacterium]|nr:PIN domain-containing protein [Candidatus Yanofskybacteria bacterium]
MRLVDANILLRYYIENVSEHTKAAKRLIVRLESGEEKAAVSFTAISEVIFTLERSYKISHADIRKYVMFLMTLNGLSMEAADLIQEALEVYEKARIPFGDAVQVAYMRQRGIQEIYSFDHDFDKVSGIVRLEP